MFFTHSEASQGNTVRWWKNGKTRLINLKQVYKVGFKGRDEPEKIKLFIKEAYDHNKLIGAICAAPSVLSDAGILEGRNCTIYPGMETEIRKGKGNPMEDIVVVDKNIVTSRGPATAIPFSLKLGELLVGKEIAEKVRRATLADIVLK